MPNIMYNLMSVCISTVYIKQITRSCHSYTIVNFVVSLVKKCVSPFMIKEVLYTLKCPSLCFETSDIGDVHWLILAWI